MSGYTVSVGTGGCFPQKVTIWLRPTRGAVTVAAHENWRTARRLRGHVSTAELATFAAEVTARTATVSALQGRDEPEPLADPEPWTRYALPGRDGPVTKRVDGFDPAVADWLCDWLDTLATVRQARVWVPRPLPRTWLGRRLGGEWFRSALSAVAFGLTAFGLVSAVAGLTTPSFLTTAAVSLAIGILLFVWLHRRFGPWIRAGQTSATAPQQTSTMSHQ